MRRAEIVRGGVYGDGRGGVRRVIGEADTRYRHQKDRDTIQYEVLEGRRQGGRFTMTRNAFARWAAERVAR